jgi:predicted metal-dependent TIM-barrel fold hydrolase
VLYTLPPARIAEVIRIIGADRVILSSDAGLKGNGWPCGNVARVLELLQAEGIADNDLRRLVVDNPADLLAI